MPAPLGRLLILYLDRTGAGALEQAHSAVRTNRIAESSICVDNERQVDHFGDCGDVSG
jgi:hypothetical protein